MDDDKLRTAKFYVLRLINIRPRSNKELQDRLVEKGYPADVIETLVAEFAAKGILDDAKFSKLWIDSRASFKPKGRSVLKRELQAKGVSGQVIEQALKEADKDYNEYDVVKKLAEGRMKRLQGLDNTTTKRRLFGFLKRRGFGFDIIMKVIDECIHEN